MRRLTEEERAQRVSKTQRKHEMHDLQELGEQLARMSEERLARVAMPEPLREALADFRRMTKHEARRRQMQYIGRLMRGADPEPLREALAAAEGRSARETARQHRLERLRAELLESEDTLARIGADHPGADLQRLRQLRHSALQEHEQGKPPRAFRELFRVLRQIEADGTGAPEPGDGPLGA
jgi:ribosome-associated protein